MHCRLETECGNTKMTGERTGAHTGAAGVADSNATRADTTAPHSNLKMDAEKGVPESGEQLISNGSKNPATKPCCTKCCSSWAKQALQP